MRKVQWQTNYNTLNQQRKEYTEDSYYNKMTSLIKQNKVRYIMSGTPENKLKFGLQEINSFNLLDIQIKPTLPRNKYKANKQNMKEGKTMMRILNDWEGETVKRSNISY